MKPAHKLRLRGNLSRSCVLIVLAGLLCTQAAFAQSLPARLGGLDGDGQPTVLDLVRLINYVHGDATVLPSFLGLTLREREVFADVRGLVERRGYVFDSYHGNADRSLSLRSSRDTNAGPLLPPTR